MIQNPKNDLPPVYLARRVACDGPRSQATMYDRVIKLSGPTKAKFILFRERDSHQRMESSWYSDHGAKVETTLRMGLKGGLNLLSSESDSMVIKSLHFDGHQHYGRRISRERIVQRLTEGLRPYCSFSPNLEICDDGSNHKRKQGSQSYEDCQFLQLTDLLVGAFRTVLGGFRVNDSQLRVSYPVKQLTDRWHQGLARMRNSRWFKGFCMSQCYIENGKWVFDSSFATKCDQLKLL
ncbi:MAG: hypothetical protein A2V73_00545 [candidate division Zixibacteria bacterium RBG_19FT_COMBO_42_43]|nr:MAG: hypothetical protein A2V73_00545 [candidate division Zixibacteria bacterium RBG_19FT_COMBO_42_43]